MGCHNIKNHTKPTPAEFNQTPENIRPRPRRVTRIRKNSYIRKRGTHRLEEFEFIQKIGAGSFGSVYKVQDKVTHQYRAIKSILKWKVPTANILREIEILKELVLSIQDHPNIIQIFEFIEEEKELHIVMELCEGQSLLDKITEQNFLSEDEIAHYMDEIISATMYCHSKGIIHRDIKPDNILFESSNQDSLLKIIDFGLSNKLHSIRKLTSFAGTVSIIQPYFIAPDVLNRSYDESCDLWSIGVLLYMMLSGKVPFSARDPKVLFQQIGKGNLNLECKDLKEVSPGAKDLIKRLLVVNPRRRLTAEQAFNHSWIRTRASRVIIGSSTNNQYIKRLKEFNAETYFREAVLQFIVTRMSDNEEILGLKALFVALDRNGDGKISSEELREGCRVFRLGVNDVQEVMDRCDIDGDGFLDFSEFLTATYDWEKDLTVEKIRKAFEAFDHNAKGVISVQELEEFADDELVSKEFLDSMIQEADVNGDGLIDIRYKIQIDYARTHLI